jgi:hypothetical protein
VLSVFVATRCNHTTSLVPVFLEFNMFIRLIKAATLLACAVFSTLALADPPARVGRLSVAQGQVSISGEVGDQASAAQVNWPVTSHNQITTGRGARTEIRIGSSAIRLDADSSMEVSELDDDRLRLHLNYGSANVRILNPEVLAGFELSTPNGSIRLQQPGRMRVDTERVRGTTVVNVFDGVAQVEDRGSQLIVRAGKRAEISDDDVRTGLAVRDSFDDWARLRDQLEERSTSARYVTREMTGYEDLDRNGVWRDDPDYGPLWLPTVVAPGWAPYRDGSWTWISPWGWTWVDNAPWGYAPFHYGRWVQHNHRWAWAPGRHVSRPVWAPALVGWVGGGGWSLSFGSNHGQRPLPAQGWYPLTPRDAFVPGYRISHDHLQHINRDAGRDGRGDWRGRDGRGEHQREGLTVVPHEQFGHRGTVAVRNAPRAVVPPLALQNAPAAAPAAPQGFGHERERRGDRFDRDASQRRDHDDRDALQRNRQHRPELTGVPAPMPQQPVINPAFVPGQAQPQVPAPSPFSRRDGRPGFDERGRRQQVAPVAPPQPQAPLVTAPAAASATPSPVTMPPPFERRDSRPNFGERREGRPNFDERREGRPNFDERRQRQQPAPQALPTPPAAAAAPMPPAQQAVTAPPALEQHQRGRGFRNDGERRMREPDAGAAMPAQPPRQFAPAPTFHQQPAPAPAPVAPSAPAAAAVVVRQAPPPAAAPHASAPAPAAAAASAPSERRNHPEHERKRAGDRENER